MRSGFFRAAAVAGVLLLCLGCSGEQVAPSPEILRLDDGHVIVYHRDNLYHFRRHNWALYGWIRELTNQGKGPAVVIHFDSHSDMHPARTCPEENDLQQRSAGALEAYAAGLPIGAFVFPAMYYGFVDEVYWVQPGISAYQGPMESASFRLVEQDGWIVPALRPGARPAPREVLGVRAHEGRPVSRLDDLASAYGYAPSEWEEGPLSLHALDLGRMVQRVREGALDGCPVILDIDLDYFGTGGEMRGYGYFAFHPGSHVAATVLQSTLPVFYLAPDLRRHEVEEVLDLCRSLRPAAVTLAESPDHSHRDALPELVETFRSQLDGGFAPGTEGGGRSLQGETIVLQAATEGGYATLDPECARRIDLAGEDSLRIRLDLEPESRDSLELTVYFNPRGSRDRMVARRVIAPGARQGTWSWPLSLLEQGSWPGHGWEIELRERSSGLLLRSVGFALADGLTDLETILAQPEAARTGDFATDQGEELGSLGSLLMLDAVELAGMPPSRIIALARGRGLSPGEIHQILLAHPDALYWQCENLRGFRRGSGTIR